MENFCMDFTLLYCAKLVSKNPAKRVRTALAAALGACFAVAFPLFGLKGWAAAAVKIFSGLAICVTAGKFRTVGGYAKYTAAFFAFSAALAGAIYGVFSLAGLSYEAGVGYIISPVPVGIPLFGAVCLVWIAKAIKNRLKKAGKNAVACKIFSGDKKVSLSGFYDSGNKVFFRGEPVTVIPETSARKLVDVLGIKDSVKIHTVAGSERMKVFTADRIEVDDGVKISTFYGVKIGVSPARINCAVLNPDVSED